MGLCVFLCADDVFPQPPPTPAPSENAPGNRTFSGIFQPINVTATRSRKTVVDIPGAVTRVGRPGIRKFKPTLTLNESLAGVPGIFSQNPFNFAQDLRLAIRGFGARSSFGVRGIKILVDGLPETLPDGQTQVDSIDPGIIDHIEIIRGPSSSLYGNASGGVLAITTDEWPESGLKISPRLTFGQFGLAKEQIKVAGTKDNVHYRLYASHLTFNGFRKHSETENNLFRAKFRIAADSRSDWTVSFSHLDSPTAMDPGALTREQAAANPKQANARNLLFSAGEAVEQQNIGVRYRKSLSALHALTVTAHLIRRNFSNKLPFTNGGIVEFNRIAPGAGIKSVYNRKLFGRRNRLISGVDTQHQRDDRQRFNNNLGTKGGLVLDQVEEVLGLGVYLRNEFRLTERAELVGGVRYDRIHFRAGDRFRKNGDQSGSRTLSQATGTAGAVYRWQDSLHLYANMATVFETPTTTELTNNPTGIGGFNADLNSQESVSYEIGAKGTLRQNLRYELALFFMTSDNEIVPFELPQFPRRAFFRNAGRSERKGAELSINFRPVAEVEGTVSYTYSDFRFTEFASGGTDFGGNTIPGIPVNRVYGRLRYNHPAGLFAEWEAQHVGGFFVDNENFNQNSAYTLSNLRMGWEKKFRSFRGSVFLGLNNLLDETYNANTRINAANGRFFEPGAPFNVYGGISLVYSPTS